MARQLDLDDSIALLKHYEIDVAAGHSREGTSIAIRGGSTPEAESVITVTLGAHSAHRICPVTEFLAEGLVTELGVPHLQNRPQLGRAVAHLIGKASHMYLNSALAGFSLTVLLEGDHYEVLPKGLTIEASSATEIPHRLTPHAHDRGPVRP